MSPVSRILNTCKDYIPPPFKPPAGDNIPMERVRVAFAIIRREPNRAVEVLDREFREAPEILIPAVAYFVAQALQGEVIAPEHLPLPPT